MNTTSDPLSYEVHEVEGAQVLRFRTRRIFRAEEIPQLAGDIRDAVHEGDGGVILNLATVEFISSSGLGLFVELDTRLKRRGRRLVLCNLQPKPLEIIALLRLDTVLAVVPDEATAVRSLRS